MSLIVNRATARVAAALSHVGLSRVNRAVKPALWRLAGNRVTVEVDGLRISGPAESWSVLSQVQAGAFEPFELELFTAELEPGGVVLDVGANIGLYSLLAARRVGPAGRVFAFEPDPRTRAFLEHNLRANHLTNVVVIPKAASDSNERRVFFQSRSAAHSGLSASGIEPIVGTTTVETVRIDDVLNGLIVDTAKLDVEGHEAAALRGMERTLARSPALRLFVEFYPAALRAAGTEPGTFRQTLTASFHDVSVVDERSRSLEPVSLAGTRRLCNLYCRGARTARTP
jgi:FkbM family methyltransferase